MRSSRRAGVLVVTIRGAIVHADAERLTDRLRASLRASAAGTVVCDVAGLVEVDMAAVDALARLALVARRDGRRLRLRGASPALRELIALSGLAGVLHVEPRRQAEQREEPGGIEEERDAADPPA